MLSNGLLKPWKGYPGHMTVSKWCQANIPPQRDIRYTCRTRRKQLPRCLHCTLSVSTSSQLRNCHKMAIHGRAWIATSVEPRMRVKVVLAASALLYRFSWPFIDTYTPGMPQGAIYSLLTKFIFAFIGLSCFVSLIPALRSKRLDSRRPANQFTYYTAILICLLVTTMNYVAGWRWALVAIDEYFTRGYLFDDPSPFDQAAVVLCSCVLSGILLALGVTQWIRIGSHWREAQRELWHREVDVKDGRLDRTSSLMMAEKSGLWKRRSRSWNSWRILRTRSCRSATIISFCALEALSFVHRAALMDFESSSYGGEYPTFIDTIIVM